MLTLSHGAWAESYPHFFCEWRTEIGHAAGVIPPDTSWFEVDLKAFYAVTDLIGNWYETPSDILWTLLAHSAFKGFIAHHHLLPLADRLDGILLTEFEYTKDPATTYGRGKRLVAGLRAAHSTGDRIDFNFVID